MIKKPRLVNSQTITIYRHGEIQEENHFILMNPTSNFKIVDKRYFLLYNEYRNKD